MKLFYTSKFYAATAIMLIASVLFSLNTEAQGIEPIDSDWDGRFEISTKEHLLYLSENSNADLYADYEQTGDIVFTDADFQPGGDFYNNGKGFLPIKVSNWSGFYGDYDGQQYIIDGLYVNRPDEDYTGFFGKTSNSEITNLRLTNVNITGKDLTGGLTGHAYSSTIEDCMVSGSVNGNDKTGGVAGFTIYSTVRRTSADVDVSGNNNVGGFVGENYNISKIYNSYATGNVSGNDIVGGFIGTNEYNIYKCYSTGHVSGNSNTGGFAGDEGFWTYIYDCFWDTQTSGQPADPNSDATGKTTAEMKDVATFTLLTTEGLSEAWDFKNNPNDDNNNEEIWKMDSSGDENNGYPMLHWKKQLTMSGTFTVEDKIYDGSSDASISENNITLQGIEGSDQVNIESVTAEFISSDAGSDIIVILTNVTLGGDHSKNYTVSLEGSPTASGNIAKKTLTVTANDHEREQCAQNPEFTFAYAGFLDGQDESFLTTEPVTDCEATPSSIPGEYDITLSGGDDENYAFNYVNGTLTIIADTTNPVVLTQDITVELDENGEASITAAQVDNGSSDNCGIDEMLVMPSTFGCAHLGQNTVSLVVTDAEGNESSAEAIVMVKDNISPIAMAQDLTIELDADGIASITPEMVDNGSSDNCSVEHFSLNISQFDCETLGPNEVTLTVEDAAGNLDEATAVITVEDNLAPEVITQPVTLYLDMSGEATLIPEMLDNGSTDNCGIADMGVDLEFFSCGDTGEHSVFLTVTDNNGNSSSATETVTVLDTITPSALQVNPEAPLCYGSSEGQIEVIPQDGFGEMAFSIDNGATWQQGDGLFTDLTAGSYNIVVESANGCLVYHEDNPIVFEEPEELVINGLEVTDATCNGAANGMIDVEAAGGTGTRYFSADGGVTWQEGHLLYGLPAGSYEVMVMDDNGCVTAYAQNPVVINEPEALVYEQVLTTDVTCNGTASGTIDILASGGTGTIEYSIGDGIWQTDGLFEELEAGEYELRIRDDRNCLNIYDENPVVLSEPEALVIDDVTVEDVNCFEGNDGSIELMTSGGTGMHQFSIDGGASWQSENLFAGLESGSYEVMVKDENECVTIYANNPVTIEQPDELVISEVTTDDLSCFGSDDGQITVEAAGGSGMLQYGLDGQWQTESTFGSLAPGEYQIEVKDENECHTVYAQNPVMITEPEAIDVSITASADTAMVDETITLTAECNYEDADCYWAPLGIYSEQVEVSEQQVGEYEYTVTATNENGCEADDTKVLVFTINTSVDGTEQIVKVFVMPNPTDGKFTVRVEGMPENYSLGIYSSNGQLLVEKKDVPLHQTEHEFNLTNTLPGTYLLRVSCDHSQWVRKIILH